jgi:hypothetical protein
MVRLYPLGSESSEDMSVIVRSSWLAVALHTTTRIGVCAGQPGRDDGPDSERLWPPAPIGYTGRATSRTDYFTPLDLAGYRTDEAGTHGRT